MTEERRPDEEPELENEPEATIQPLSDATLHVADRVEEIIGKLTVAGNVNAVFGEPRTIGDRTIIPVARVATGGGFGFGSGQAEPVPSAPPSGGAGAGGGGGATAAPIAAIVVTPEGVRVQPIVDATQVAMAAIASLAFNLFWIIRLLRAVRAPEHVEKLGGEVSLGKLRRLFRC